MSDIDQSGCFRHRANVRYFTIYEDFQDISKGHHLPAPTQGQSEEEKKLIKAIKEGTHADKIAAFLRILEVKTNRKIITWQVLTEEAEKSGTPAPKLNLWIEMTYADFVSWSLHTVGRSSFQIADKATELLLFSKSRVLKRPTNPTDPDSKMTDYKEYLLVMENVQAALDRKELPIIGKDYEDYDTPVVFNSPLLKTTAPAVENNRGGLLKTTAGAVENNSNVSNSKSNGLKEKKKESSTSPADAATTIFSSLTEKEKQIVSWFCEITGCQLEQVSITDAAQRSLKMIAPDVETKNDVQELYDLKKQNLIDSNARNQTVFIANLKDVLLGWKQNKSAVPAAAHQEASASDPQELVLWSRHVDSPEFKLDKSAWFLFEWMTRAEAEHYDFAGIRPLSATKAREISRRLQEEKDGKLQRPPLVPA